VRWAPEALRDRCSEWEDSYRNQQNTVSQAMIEIIKSLPTQPHDAVCLCVCVSVCLCVCVCLWFFVESVPALVLLAGSRPSPQHSAGCAHTLFLGAFTSTL
jgi:hypothetical protein